MPAPTGLALALLVIGSAAAQQRSAAITPTERVLEIRSYNLKAGTRENFHELFVREALPLLRLWKVDVVAYGPSWATSRSCMRGRRSLCRMAHLVQAVTRMCGHGASDSGLPSPPTSPDGEGPRSLTEILW